MPYGESVLVEYPAFVENPDAAIATLGGPDAVRATLFGADAKHTELALRFRPADPLAHPILADRTPTNGLLLRITRRPGQAQCSAEVAARITSTYQFQGPADMQYISADTGVSPPQVFRQPCSLSQLLQSVGCWPAACRHEPGWHLELYHLHRLEATLQAGTLSLS